MNNHKIFEDTGMTIKAIAQETGIHYETLKKIKQGKQSFPDDLKRLLLEIKKTHAMIFDRYRKGI